jgi:hypothetical protein
MASIRYRRATNAVAADLGEGKLAIMGLAKGRYYALNPVGRVIWECLEQPRSREDLRAEVQARFEIDAATCERDTEKFLKELLDEGLAEVSS